MQDWEDVQTLMGRTGRNGLVFLVSHFSIETVPEVIKDTVKVMLKGYTEEEARLASAGVGTFFVWVGTSMCFLLNS